MAVNLQQRKRWSLTDLDIHNLRAVSELQSSNSYCYNNMPEKITRDRREMETRVCSSCKQTPVSFPLYYLFYWYFILPAIKPDNPDLCFVLAHNSHYTTGQWAEHKAHPFNLSTTTYIWCTSYHMILAVPENQMSLFSQAPRDRMAHTEHTEYTNLQRKIVLRSVTHSRNWAKFSSTWKP